MDPTPYRRPEPAAVTEVLFPPLKAAAMAPGERRTYHEGEYEVRISRAPTPQHYEVGWYLFEHDRLPEFTEYYDGERWHDHERGVPTEEGYDAPRRLLTYRDIEHLILGYPGVRIGLEELLHLLKREWGIERDD